MKDEARAAGHQRAADRKEPSPAQQARMELARRLRSFKHDPYGFVLWAFPWAEQGGPLAGESGPDVWQREQLERIGSKLTENPHQIIREITASGHGIGKSAEVGWIGLWAMLTAVDTRGVVTANTDTQLRTKTWAELSKWFHLMHPFIRAQFELTATALYAREPEHQKSWRIDAIPNSPTNPAAFAGTHNAGKRILIVVDEGSEIADVIYETIEGALTDADTEIIYLVFGNPTKPTGRFREMAVGRFRGEWQFNQVDSRKVKRTNKVELAKWAALWGEDSDFYRIRVRGEFPRVGMLQLIGSDIVQAARVRDPGYIMSDPLILGVDVAAYGDDQSVLAPRRGNDAKSIPWRRFRGIEVMDLAAEIVQFHREVGFDAIFVDIGGVGVGVYSRLMQLNVPGVIPVQFGAKGGVTSYNGTDVMAFNKRAGMYLGAREWLRLGGAIPDDPDIETDLTGVQYGYRDLAGASAVLLESKEHMKLRGLASPDNADALVCTFAYPVQPRMPTHPDLPGSGSIGPQSTLQQDYDIFADLRG